MGKIFNILGSMAKTKLAISAAVVVTSATAIGVTYVAVNSKPVEETKIENKIETSSKQDTHSHSYTEKETKNASCTEAGYIVYSCDCGDEYTKGLSQTGHISGNWEIIKEPSIKENGLRQNKCTICGEITQTEPIRLDIEEKAETQAPAVDALENVDVEKYRIDGNGNVTDINQKEELEIVPVIHEHNYKEEIIEKPSCLKAGTNKYTCECGANYTKLTEKTAHKTNTKINKGNCTTNETEEEI